jgi:integrase
MDDYLAHKEAGGIPAVDARWRNDAFIKPQLGTIDMARLTAKKIREWIATLAKQPPRLRTVKGEEQRFQKIEMDAEQRRRRQASVNRTLTTLKAALNHAFREGEVASDIAWRRVKPFEGVDVARIRWLALDEAKRLINTCDPDFRKIVQAALQTGARYGQLAALVAADFNAAAGTVTMRTRKGKGAEVAYNVVLTPEGVALFEQWCAGHGRNDLIFRKASGEAWGKSHQKREMADACKAAKLKPAIGFHGLRHTWASLSIMRGVPLLIVAKNLGHSDTRMVEKHYGHMSPSHIADAIRAGAPRFGRPKVGNVMPMRAPR